jgi:integrase
MPREAKPYVERGWYISRPNNQYLKLCPVSDGMTEAKRLLREKLAAMDAERQQMGGRLAPKLTVEELFGLFLDVVQAEKDEDTYLDYRRWCAEFVDAHGSRPARDITKADAADFKLALMKKTYTVGKQSPRRYKPKTVNHALITVKRAFNWAIETDRLPPGRNPFSHVELLPCEGRQRVATEDEYQALLRHCTDDAFRHVLIAMRHSSARPQDIYDLEWRMVFWDEPARWVLEKHKGRRTQRVKKPRVIGMGDKVAAVLRERQEKYGGKGHVFLNEDGRPWNKDSLGLRMRRHRARAGIKPDENGEHLVLYSNRHTFLTAAGADPTISQGTLMELAGHTDPRTTTRYVHTARAAIADAGRRVADNLSAPSAGNGG